MWRIAFGEFEDQEQEDPSAVEVQGHYKSNRGGNSLPPQVSRVEYFRQLDAKARRDKALAAQREAERVEAAKQALIDSELRRQKGAGSIGCCTVVSAEIEHAIRAADGIDEAFDASTLFATDQHEVDAEVLLSTVEADMDSQIAATRSAELLAAGGGDDGLRNRVASAGCSMSSSGARACTDEDLRSTVDLVGISRRTHHQCFVLFFHLAMHCDRSILYQSPISTPNSKLPPTSCPATVLRRTCGCRIGRRRCVLTRAGLLALDNPPSPSTLSPADPAMESRSVY